MKKELYDQLDYKEKMLYDEMHEFSKRLAERMDEIILLLKTIISSAEDPPSS